MNETNETLRVAWVLLGWHGVALVAALLLPIFALVAAEASRRGPPGRKAP